MLFFSLANLSSPFPSWCARPGVSLGSPPLSLAVEASRHSLPKVRQQLPAVQEELWYFSEVFVFSPLGMQFSSVWVGFAFACGWLFHCAEEFIFLCFLLDSGIFLRLVACFMAAFFQLYIVRFSKPVRQGILGTSTFIIVILKLRPPCKTTKLWTCCVVLLPNQLACNSY